MKALSLDLRQRIVDAYEAGEGSQAKVAQRFQVGQATVERLVRLKRETGSSVRPARSDPDRTAAASRRVSPQPTERPSSRASSASPT